MKITYREFSSVYQEKVKDVLKHYTPEMQTEIAKHNQGWAAPYSFENYLINSVTRYYNIIASMKEQTKSIADIGGFWSVFPLTMKEFGFDVYMTEAKKYYSNSFDNLFNHIEKQGVKIIDTDPFSEDLSSIGTFDLVTIMAVLEHYPHSLKFFLNNINSILTQGSQLFIEVPNILYIYKRFEMLFGKSPLPDIETILNSATPFTGHHHEYSIEELRKLFKIMGLTIQDEYFYTYSFNWKSLKYALHQPIHFSSMALIPNSREVIAVCGIK